RRGRGRAGGAERHPAARDPALRQDRVLLFRQPDAGRGRDPRDAAGVPHRPEPAEGGQDHHPVLCLLSRRGRGRRCRRERGGRGRVRQFRVNVPRPVLSRSRHYRIQREYRGNPMSDQHGSYYLPEPTKWPTITSAGIFLLALGFILFMNEFSGAHWLMLLGVAVLIFVLIGWFGEVASESERGLYDSQVDMSFRMGMGWFITSEVFFFAAFF